MTDQFDYTITSDGGSEGNGTADARGYGSYHIKTQDGREALALSETSSASTLASASPTT